MPRRSCNREINEPNLNARTPQGYACPKRFTARETRRAGSCADSRQGKEVATHFRRVENRFQRVGYRYTQQPNIALT